MWNSLECLGGGWDSIEVSRCVVYSVTIKRTGIEKREKLIRYLKARSRLTTRVGSGVTRIHELDFFISL